VKLQPAPKKVFVVKVRQVQVVYKFFTRLASNILGGSSMSKLNVILVGFVGLLLAGCGTPYKPASVWDPRNGYTEVFLDNTRVVITFSSTRQDRGEAVIRGAMLRAAELAKERGFDAFVVLSDTGNESTTGFTTGGTYTATTIGGQTFGTVTPGIPIIISQAQHRITVQFINGYSSGSSAFKADEVILENKKRFK
jgi:hypothetical protein